MDIEHTGRKSGCKVLGLELPMFFCNIQVVKGTMRFPAQLHMYMETQTSVVRPTESGGLSVVSGSGLLVLCIRIATIGFPGPQHRCQTNKAQGTATWFNLAFQAHGLRSRS